MVRQLRPLIRNDTEAPELWGSIQEQLPQCMRDSAARAARDSSAPIGRKRAADDVLPGPPQKRPALKEVGCPVFKDRARFPNICASPTGTLVALGTVGTKRERRVMARRSTDQGDTWQAPVHLADGINGGGLRHDARKGHFIAFVESSHPPAEKMVFRSADDGVSWQRC